MIEMIMELSKNPIFGGIIGGSLIAGLMVYLKSVPLYIWNWFKRYFIYTLTIDNTQDSFQTVEKWLASLNYSNNKCKKIQLKSFKYDEKKYNLTTVMGYGSHVFIYDKNIFYVTRNLDSKEQHIHRERPETITISCIGVNKKSVKKIIKEIEDLQNKNRDKINIYIPSSRGWSHSKSKEKRGFNSVFLPADQKNRILNDIEKFENSKEEYLKKSIAYKRGYLFKGPPGTGKTTLAFSLAAYCDKHIYYLNLNSIANDADLMEIFKSIPKDVILIMEDIDCALTEQRINPEEKEEKENKEKKTGVSLSCILNCLDGIIAKEDLIIIMTTNHSEKIDPALLRPGRIDIIETIDYIQPMEIVEMCNHLLDDKSQISNFVQELDFENLTAAELQNKILIKNAA